MVATCAAGRIAGSCLAIHGKAPKASPTQPLPSRVPSRNAPCLTSLQRIASPSDGILCATTVRSRARIAMAAAGSAAGSGELRFSKYQGIGNDFILVDNRHSSEPVVSQEQAARLCDRNFGVGGDGVIFLLPGQAGADYTMRIFNSDGSEPEMCGNGIRCLAKFIADVTNSHDTQTISISTLAGVMQAHMRADGQVRVDMGEPILSAALIPTTLPATTADGAVVKAPLQVDGVTWQVTCVSMGNPHCITFSNSDNPQGLDVAGIDLHRIGPMFEHHPAFPARTNTEFVEVISRNELRMRVWERGAGPTLACGTGTCALVVAAVLEGRAERNCLVHLPGGPLEIDWREEDNRVHMTGPADLVFSGSLALH